MPFQRRKALLFLAFAILVGTIAALVDRGKIMTPEITVPYFSGAALGSGSSNWEFNRNEVDKLKKINDIADPALRKSLINDYRFSTQRAEVRSYHLNQPGLVYCIRLARFLFGFAGDILALKFLQLLLHILGCFIILNLLKTARAQTVFLVLYALNPFIIYLTLFPFYYFWQVIPSFLIIILLLNDRTQTISAIIFSVFLLAFMYLIRVTVAPISLLILLIGFRKLSWGIRIPAVLVYLLLVFWMQPSYLSKHPGHVMYSSLGAYPGSPVRGFSDNISFEDYNLATKKNYSYDTNPGMYDSEVIMGEAKWGYEQFKNFALEHPLIIIRNAGLNFFEAFSFGYLTKSIWLTYLSAFIGMLYFSLLVWRRKWLSIILITTAASAYVLYLAPVPIYLFGSYVLLVFGGTEMVSSK